MTTDNRKKKFSLGKLLLVLIVLAVVFFILVTVLGQKGGSGNKTEPDNGEKSSFTDYYNTVSTGYKGNWKLGSNVGSLDTSVASGARAKRTKILGNNKDVVTILVFMCGSDLESKSYMGSYDLQEMASAKIASNVNLIVYTGGCTNWHVQGISTRYNEIFKVVGNGSIQPLVENAGTGSMVDPQTLLSFIEWGVENYPANRYELIMWDHGSGSVGGYGYDEKYPNRGSMTLEQIDAALTEADVDWDFIGFDACLMANTEAALMLAEHADYLIASEESEPGIGWYYTDWLTALSNNTSMPTLEIGKNIADSFVSTCNKQTRGQSATLSVIDLAELQATVPSKLSAFSTATTNMITGNNFKTVSNARGSSREFAQQAYTDLVDLVDLATNTGTSEGTELAKALLGCIKYNNTTSDMYNAYGLSIYFPYRSTKYVNTVLNTYKNIDMNAEYTECVRSFVKYATSGQTASGGQHSAYQSYNGYSGNSSSYYSSQNSADMIIELFQMLAGAGSGQQQSYSNSYSGYYSLFDLLFRDGLDRNVAEYIADNHFDADLTWKDGKIEMTEKQWSMLDSIKLNLFIDDGKGYIDLGKDNYFEAEDFALLKIEDMSWLAASADKQNWQTVPFYYLSHLEEGDNMITYGRIPALLNGDYVNLIVVLDDEKGITVAGATYDYRGERDIVAKNLTELKEGDVLEFVCDYYDYEGNFVDNYVLGDKLVVTDDLYVGDADVSGYRMLVTYELTDFYQQSYWTPPME